MKKKKVLILVTLLLTLGTVVIVAFKSLESGLRLFTGKELKDSNDQRIEKNEEPKLNSNPDVLGDYEESSIQRLIDKSREYDGKSKNVYYDETGYVLLDSFVKNYDIAIFITPTDIVKIDESNYVKAILIVAIKQKTQDFSEWSLVHSQLIDHATDLIFSDNMIEFKDMTFDGLDDLVIFLSPGNLANQTFGIWQTKFEGDTLNFVYQGGYGQPEIRNDLLRSYYYCCVGTEHNIDYYQWNGNSFNKARRIEISLNEETLGNKETQEWIISYYEVTDNQEFLKKTETQNVKYPEIDNF